MKKTQQKEIEVKEIKQATHVKMQRDGLIADVHPDEVENYRKGGYSEVK